ncbi:MULTISPECIES: P1 family peptidase [Streptomyces]|uniref:Putative pantetheine hydrolase n=2 Tax=Streptomyces TaxID=1883 RepID=A0A1I6V7P7_9ACTN|nr:MULTISPECIES: P1 family peptidase [Streptomyces]SFT09672.1 putative pantetheine hydrolase [Streptomyces harbinensis]
MSELGRSSGPADALTDVPGIRVGHAQRIGDGWLTGVTVVLAPEGGAVGAVDVRGGGPGTRETDVLDPRNLVEKVNAVVLTGGSAFGLDSASGVMSWLEEQGRGYQVGPGPGQVVPIVPAAVLFDLGRGGDWHARPDAALGRAAVQDAAAGPAGPGTPVAMGTVGAGTGATTGAGTAPGEGEGGGSPGGQPKLKGGVGTASTVLPNGVTVAALVAVNAAGSPIDPDTGAFYGEDPGARPPTPEQHARARRLLAEAHHASTHRSPTAGDPPLNTTLAVVATDAVLTPAQAQKLAGTAHDGLARAVRPVHLMTDGDTVFALATGDRPLTYPDGTPPDPRWPIESGLLLSELLAAGADVLSRAVVKGIRAARGTDTPGGRFPAHRELYGRPD